MPLCLQENNVLDLNLWINIMQAVRILCQYLTFYYFIMNVIRSQTTISI